MQKQKKIKNNIEQHTDINIFRATEQQTSIANEIFDDNKNIKKDKCLKNKKNKTAKDEVVPATLQSEEEAELYSNSLESFNVVYRKLSVNSYNSFSADVGKYPLLTVKEEIELSKIIRHTTNEEQKNKAVEKFVLHNLRLVTALAWKEIKSWDSGNNDIMDLIQEGVRGLITAALKYDYETYPVKFSTYATDWIKQKIRRTTSIFRKGGISVRGMARDSYKNIHNYISLLKEGKEDEIPEKMRKAIKSLLPFVDGVLSISELPGEDEVMKIYISPTEREKNIEEVLYEEQIKEKVSDRLLNTTVLTPMEKKIISMKYGVGEYKYQQTSAAISADLGMTASAVKGILSRAIKKLRKDTVFAKIYTELE